jgi:drug/metabolite transporter (DMT)-like permease
MGYLALASLLWALSFGLIGRYLVGLDSQSVAFVRLLISLLVFAPFLRLRGLAWHHMLRLMLIGAVQYGLMYAVYIQAYQSLAGHEVALFTIMTPLFVTFLDGWRRGRFRLSYFVAAALGVAGVAALFSLKPIGQGMLPGIVMIQVANLCFAGGQVEYKLMMEREPTLSGGNGTRHFGLLYLGAVLATGLFAATSGLASFRPSPVQWWVLLYLGAVPSAVAFFLWNLGARKVNPGILGVFNNVKIPLGVVAALVVFGEQPDGGRLTVSILGVAGGILVAGGATGLMGVRRGSGDRARQENGQSTSATRPSSPR